MSGDSGSRAFRTAIRMFHRTGLLPPSFVKSMGKEDYRLPRMTLGLGVVVRKEARFYPRRALHGFSYLVDTINGQRVVVTKEA